MNIAVVFAGGVGSRMNSDDIPKQFLKIHGVSVLIRTLTVFQSTPEIDAIVVSCHADWLDRCRAEISANGITKVVAVVPGGRTGQLSIYNGLCAAEVHAAGRPAIVLVHDGVRPLVTVEHIARCIRGCEDRGSAITAVRSKETVAVFGDDHQAEEVLSRNRVCLLRAPQCFGLGDLLTAHRTAMAREEFDYIDSATLMKAMGHRLHLVEGDPDNIKITTQDDFFAVQGLLNAKENLQLRIRSEGMAN